MSLFASTIEIDIAEYASEDKSPFWAGDIARQSESCLPPPASFANALDARESSLDVDVCRIGFIFGANLFLRNILCIHKDLKAKYHHWRLSAFVSKYDNFVKLF